MLLSFKLAWIIPVSSPWGLYVAKHFSIYFFFILNKVLVFLFFILFLFHPFKIIFLILLSLVFVFQFSSVKMHR